MNKIMLSALCLFAFSLTGCDASSQKNAEQTPQQQVEEPAAPALNAQDLLHHNFVLVSINGQAYAATERTPSIAFNEGMNVSGGICNRYTGQGVLADNKLVVNQMVSTKMLCVDPALNQLETDLSKMLTEGAEIQLNGQTLILSKDDYTLEFKLKDLVI